MKHHNLVYCKHHPEDSRAFLYELPANIQVTAGDKLCVEDRRGDLLSGLQAVYCREGIPGRQPDQFHER